MIRRVAALIGTASPSPTPATAVLIPTTRPRPSASAPPEFPGLSAASVWITLSTTRTFAPGAGRQRAAEGRDDAGRDRAGEAVRVADRDDELADAQPLCIAELRRHEVARVDAQHGEVGERIGADDLELELAAVDERGAPAALGARDDVRGGEREAVRRDHDAAAAPVEHAAAADASRDAEIRDRGRQPLRHGRHGLRVGVERFLVGDLTGR